MHRTADGCGSPKPAGGRRRPTPDWGDGRGEPALGAHPDTRRIVELGFDVSERSISHLMPRAAHAAVADLAHVPQEPSRLDRRGRLLRGPHAHVQILFVFVASAWTTSSPSMSGISGESFTPTSRTASALARTSRSEDAPETRAVDPHGTGRIVAWPEVGGLHHRYERQAA